MQTFTEIIKVICFDPTNHGTRITIGVNGQVISGTVSTQNEYLAEMNKKQASSDNLLHTLAAIEKQGLLENKNPNPNPDYFILKDCLIVGAINNISLSWMQIQASSIEFFSPSSIEETELS